MGNNQKTNRSARWQWQHGVDTGILSEGKEMARSSLLRHTILRTAEDCQVIVDGNTVVLSGIPGNLFEMKRADFSSCVFCGCKVFQEKQMCAHAVAAMYLYEKRFGIIQFEDTPEARSSEQEKLRLRSMPVSAEGQIGRRIFSENMAFSPKRFLQNVPFTEYERIPAEEWLRKNTGFEVKPFLYYSDFDRKKYNSEKEQFHEPLSENGASEIVLNVDSEVDGELVHLQFGTTRMIRCVCSCRGWKKTAYDLDWYDLCWHEYAATQATLDYLQENGIVFPTRRPVAELVRRLRKWERHRTGNLQIRAVLVNTRGNCSLRFAVRKNQLESWAPVTDISAMMKAWSSKGKYALSEGQKLNFKEDIPDRTSWSWMDVLHRMESRMEEEKAVPEIRISPAELDAVMALCIKTGCFYDDGAYRPILYDELQQSSGMGTTWLKGAVFAYRIGEKSFNRMPYALEKKYFPPVEADSGDKGAEAREQQKISFFPQIYSLSRLRIVFQMGIPGKTPTRILHPYQLLDAVSSGGSYTLEDGTEVDFRKVSLNLNAYRWLAFADAMRQEDLKEDSEERKICQKSTKNGPDLFKLNGAFLDIFYDLLGEGNTVLCKQEHLQVGGESPLKRFAFSRLRGIKDGMHGFCVTGEVPKLFRGSTFMYGLTDSAFFRMNHEEGNDYQKLCADLPYGAVREVIGEEYATEFICGVLPKIFNDSFFDIDPYLAEENTTSEMHPKITFLLDADKKKNYVFCQIRADYGNFAITIPEQDGSLIKPERNRKDEYRAISVIREMLPNIDYRRYAYYDELDAERLGELISLGIRRLETVGMVEATNDFRSLNASDEKRFRFRISVGGDGLLDFQFIGDNIDEHELQEIYNAYARDKRYYRTRSGELIDLKEQSRFESLSDALRAMNVTLEEAMTGRAKLPVFRILYLREMLKNHDSLVDTRDERLQELIDGSEEILVRQYPVPPTLKNVMRDYQKDGFRWISSLFDMGFGGILADDMGLGKTLEMLSVLLARKIAGKLGTVLIISPASVVLNWLDEIQKFTPQLTAAALTGNQISRRAHMRQAKEGRGRDVYIASYSVLRNDLFSFKDVHFDVVVLDEAQNIKNAGSQIAGIVKILKAEHRFALTGTPIENRLSELWSIFDFLMPGFLYTHSKFFKDFETPITIEKDERTTQRLRKMVGPFVLRRNKKDVLTELPEKIENVFPVELNARQKKIYDAYVARYVEYINDHESFKHEELNILSMLTVMRQICCDPEMLWDNYQDGSAKREACIELIQEAIEGGHRILVFSQFVKMLKLLSRSLSEQEIPHYVLTGSTAKEDRRAMIHAFNNGNVPVFLISLKAGGTGVNLTGADMVIHYDPWWNLAAQNQATDRAYRMGQTRDVMVYKMVVRNSIEEKILEMQKAKKNLADSIISETNEMALSFTKADLLALVESME